MGCQVISNNVIDYVPCHQRERISTNCIDPKLWNVGKCNYICIFNKINSSWPCLTCLSKGTYIMKIEFFVWRKLLTEWYLRVYFNIAIVRCIHFVIVWSALCLAELHTPYFCYIKQAIFLLVWVLWQRGVWLSGHERYPLKWCMFVLSFCKSW